MKQPQNVLKTKTVLNKMFDADCGNEYDAKFLVAHILFGYFEHLRTKGYCNTQIYNDVVNVSRAIKEWCDFSDSSLPKTFEKNLVLASIFNADFRDIVFLESDDQMRKQGAFDFVMAVDLERNGDNVFVYVTLPRIRENVKSGEEQFVVHHAMLDNLIGVMKGRTILDYAKEYIIDNNLQKVASDIVKKLESVLFLYRNHRNPASIENLIMFEEITGIDIEQIYNPIFEELCFVIETSHKRALASKSTQMLNWLSRLSCNAIIKDSIRANLQKKDIEIKKVTNNCVVTTKNNKYGAIFVRGNKIKTLPHKYDYVCTKNDQAYAIQNNSVFSIDMGQLGEYDILNTSTKLDIANDVVKIKNALIEAGQLIINKGFRYYEIMQGGIIVMFPNQESVVANVRIAKAINAKHIEFRKKGKLYYGLMASQNFVIPPIYDSEVLCGEGYYTVKQNEKNILLDSHGNALGSAKYDYASVFSEGLCAVCIGGKFGYIDKNGKIVIDYVYNNAGDFSCGLAAVLVGGKYGFIDKTGKVVVPSVYDNAFIFSEGVAVVEIGGKYGYINTSGEVIIPIIYENATTCKNGKISVISSGNMIEKTIENQKKREH